MTSGSITASGGNLVFEALTGNNLELNPDGTLDVNIGSGDFDVSIPAGDMVIDTDVAIDASNFTHGWLTAQEPAITTLGMPNLPAAVAKINEIIVALQNSGITL